MNKTEVRAVEHEIDSHKAALEHLSEECCHEFEADYQFGLIEGLKLALKVARRARR